CDGAEPRAFLRAGVVRLVHAVPRRAAVRGAHPRRDRRGRRPPARPRPARDAHALPRPGPHVLRTRAWRHGAAAIRPPLLPRRLRAPHHRTRVPLPMTHAPLPLLRSTTREWLRSPQLAAAER